MVYIDAKHWQLMNCLLLLKTVLMQNSNTLNLNSNNVLLNSNVRFKKTIPPLNNLTCYLSLAMRVYMERTHEKHMDQTT